MSATPDDIFEYWLSIEPKKWFRKDDDVDAAIGKKFSDTLRDASQGKLDHWLEEPNSALALIIVLDQFSRNLNRNSPLAFAEDTRTAHLVRTIIGQDLDMQMRDDLRSFCYMPLMHAENPIDQASCVAQMHKTGIKENIDAAEEHADIIRRFGRFPHRNKVLGRQTTAEEQAFLDGGGFKG